MRILDAGHDYELTNLDSSQEDDQVQRLTFVKREGVNYPGNIGHYAGTQTQEVLRALIDRMKYVQNQIPCDVNLRVIDKLRHCLALLEIRAAERHGKNFICFEDEIEDFAPAPNGHLTQFWLDRPNPSEKGER